MATRDASCGSAPPKRMRNAVDIDVEALKCPITLELPIDPVFAADGFVYERSAILQWFGSYARSPVTNLPIETTVTPALYVKTLLDDVSQGGSAHELVTRYNMSLQMRKRINALRSKAARGNGPAMFKLAIAFYKGTGIVQDVKKAFELFQEAAEAGVVEAMFIMFSAYRRGVRSFVAKNHAESLRWLCTGSNRGCPASTFHLAVGYRKGDLGFARNDGRAFRLLVRSRRLHEGVLSCVPNLSWTYIATLYELGDMYAYGRGTAVDAAALRGCILKIEQSSNDLVSTSRVQQWLEKMRPVCAELMYENKRNAFASHLFLRLRELSCPYPDYEEAIRDALGNDQIDCNRILQREMGPDFATTLKSLSETGHPMEEPLHMLAVDDGFDAHVNAFDFEAFETPW